jgi:integrase
MSHNVNTLSSFGNTHRKQTSHLFQASVPESHRLSAAVIARPKQSTNEQTNMKLDPISNTAVAKATLQDVIDRLAANPSLSDGRKRDLRSAVVTFAKLIGKAPALIPLDLAHIRATLDAMVPAQARVSPKRWANLRSDLAAAIEASGLRPMLKTGSIDLDENWCSLLQPVTDQRVRNGLSRLARWASRYKIAPAAVDDAVIERFIAELEAASLVRGIRDLHGSVAASWNALVRFQPERGLQTIRVPSSKPAPRRVRWEDLPVSFQADVARYLAWAAMPDPLDANARARALAPRTLHLRRDHIHSAVTAAAAAGIAVEDLNSLASLAEIATFKALLRHLWEQGGRRLTAYIHGVAGTLIAIAKEWVKIPTETLTALKTLRRKLGPLPTGLTEKNRTLLRAFDDARRLEALLQLPDKLWRRARRELAMSRRPFIDLQSALAIDFLLHVPLRMENLAALNFEKHLHWPQGRGKPALLVFGVDETKNEVRLEYEIPAVLAERLQVYRNEIAPAVTGKRPDAVFVSWSGKPRTQAALTVAIEKTIRRHLGVKLTPHQFRHLAAKIILDANPGAYELVRQMLGHRNMKTTTNFYAGIDTRRAGRAHADLLMEIRESRMRRKRHRRKMQAGED